MFFFFGIEDSFDVLDLGFGSDAEVGFPEIVDVLHLYDLEFPFCFVHSSITIYY